MCSGGQAATHDTARRGAPEAPPVLALEGSRLPWAAARAAMEVESAKRSADGRWRPRYWDMFRTATDVFGIGLRLTGLYGRGVRNALDIRLRALDIVCADLPEAFDGYTVLHLSDLHIDALPGLDAVVAQLAGRIEVDLAVLTGDYRYRVSGPHAQIIRPMRQVIGALRARDGVFGVLGNHDSVRMVAPLEDAGLRLLINESAAIRRDGATVSLVGTDDVHYYFSERAAAALAAPLDGFKIALVHSPELVPAAAAAGFSLYLTGHTHHGQVCLPGGLPIITHVGAHRRYARGIWRAGAMTGHTTSGVGVSALPVRFNSRGEIALLTLRCGPARPARPVSGGI